MYLKQTFKNHIAVSWFSWFYAIGVFILWWHFKFANDALMIIGVYSLFFITPALYLHIEYYLRNKGEEIEVNENYIRIIKNGKEIKYYQNEFIKIVLYKDRNLDKWGIPLSAMQYYNYLRIVTKSGEDIIITCLLTRNLEEVVNIFNAIPFERHYIFFCSTKIRGPI